jgi:hypothetical protein
MTTSAAPGGATGWNAIERERRLDRLVRRICVAAWSATFVLTGCYAALVGREVLFELRLQAVGGATTESVLAVATPLVIALGILALLVAALSTVAIFLRFRTAALGEIQLRLAALEAMLTAGGAGPVGTGR